MKTLFTTLALFCFSLSMIAQSDLPTTTQTIGHLQFTLAPLPRVSSGPIQVNLPGQDEQLIFSLTDARLSPSIMLQRIKPSGWFSTYGLVTLRADRNSAAVSESLTPNQPNLFDISSSQAFQLGLTYQVGRQWSKSPTQRLVPSLALGATPYLTTLSSTIFNANHPGLSVYSTRSSTIGVQLQLVPGLHYRISDRVSANISLPVSLMSMQQRWTKAENISDSVENSQSSFGLEVALGFYQWGASVGYRF